MARKLRSKRRTNRSKKVRRHTRGGRFERSRPWHSFKKGFYKRTSRANKPSVRRLKYEWNHTLKDARKDLPETDEMKYDYINNFDVPEMFYTQNNLPYKKLKKRT